MDQDTTLPLHPPSELQPHGGARTPEPEASREFGEYVLLEEIGRGGMGIVYKARQKRLDRVVALKIIQAGLWASDDQIRRFQVEARAAAALSHPNIVKIFDTGEVLGQHYFAMEYVPGSSLAAALGRAAIGVRDAVKMVRAVARALDHLHRHGIVHRDLKPGNILLDAAGQPYVTDFGLAKVFGQDPTTRTGVIAGTPCYMSPEQAAGRLGELDARSDLYSLGTVLYELLTGRPPFVADSPMDTLVQVIERDPPAPRELNRRIPRELELICLRCLAKARDDRYPSADALGEDLDRFLAGEPVEARPPRLHQRVFRWARREPPLALRLAGLGLFYLVELANYHLFHVIPLDWHLKVSGVLAFWALASVALQQVLKRERWETAAIFAWEALDLLAVSEILYLADGAASPLVVAYPLLVAASGLWLRVRFVWFTTVAAILSYGWLVADFYLWRPALQERFDPGFDRHVFFVLMLLLLGSVVAYHVGRARALSQFYASRGRPWTRPSS